MPPRLPECWGHRGASLTYPENTLASFERAIQDGAEGIETDVHVSRDGVVIMFHDATLERTTNGHGLIKDCNYYGPDGIQQMRTTKTPTQPIPTFDETIALFMRPEYRHAMLHLDVKPTNDVAKILPLMAGAIEAYPNWQTDLAPRIVLGVWHTSYVCPSQKLLSDCRLAHIGLNVTLARTYFWECCHVISLHWTQWNTWAGQRFLKECKAAGKTTRVWTVNDPHEMAEAIRWGIDVIMTDVPHVLHQLRKDLATDYDKTLARYPRSVLYKRLRSHYPFAFLLANLARILLQVRFGWFSRVSVGTVMTKKAMEADGYARGAPGQVAVGKN